MKHRTHPRSTRPYSVTPRPLPRPAARASYTPYKRYSPPLAAEFGRSLRARRNSAIWRDGFFCLAGLAVLGLVVYGFFWGQ